MKEITLPGERYSNTTHRGSTTTMYKKRPVGTIKIERKEE